MGRVAEGKDQYLNEEETVKKMQGWGIKEQTI